MRKTHIIIALAMTGQAFGACAANIHEGFPAFRENDWCIRQVKFEKCEGAWPKVVILAKWVGDIEELLHQLTSPEWVAKVLGRNSTKIQGKRTTDGGVYTVKFPVLGSIEIPIQHRVIQSINGFKIAFQSQSLWAADFNGEIEVEKIPINFRTVEPAIQPDGFIFCITLVANPRFPLAGALTEAYKDTVSHQAFSILMQHTDEFINNRSGPETTRQIVFK